MKDVNLIKWPAILLKTTVVVILVVHVGLGLYIAVNNISSRVTLGGESFYMTTYLQYARGLHSYYEPNLKLVSWGYTPLTGQIFGWVIKLFGNDIRVVRFCAFLFGMGAVLLCGMIVKKMTRNTFLAFVAASLALAVEPEWFMDTGPNTIHVFFTLAGLFFLVLDNRECKWRWMTCAMLCFVASFWAKQTGLGYLVAAMVYVLLLNVRRGLIVSISAIALIALNIMYFELLPDSKFIYHVFQNVNQPLIWNRLWDPIFFPILTGRFGLFLCMVTIGLVVSIRRLDDCFKANVVILGATAFIGLLTSLKYGSGMAQAWAFYCLLVINGCYYTHALLETKRIDILVLYGVICFQGLALFQSIGSHLINKEDENRYYWVMQYLKTPGKKAHYLNNTYYNILLGREHYVLSYDCWLNKQFRRDLYPKVLADFINTDPFDILIINVPFEDNSFLFYERLNVAYTPMAELPASRDYPNTWALRMRKIVFQKK